MTRSGVSRPSFLRSWLIWTAGFLAFPVAGLAGTAVAGRVDTPAAALLGGAVTGLVIGAGQAVVSSRRLDPRRWIPATAAGMSLGLLLGAATVGYRTALGDLALMGALTGLVLGVAQAIALPRRTHRRWMWAAALPVLWALGWTATTLGGIAVDQQFTVFGAYGAVTFSALSGLLLHRLLPHPARKCPARKCPAGPGSHTQRHGAVIRSRHVTLGTDAIGPNTLNPRRRGGETVRPVNRSGPPRVPDDVTVTSGGASEPAVTTPSHAPQHDGTSGDGGRGHSSPPTTPAGVHRPHDITTSDLERAQPGAAHLRGWAEHRLPAVRRSPSCPMT